RSTRRAQLKFTHALFAMLCALVFSWSPVAAHAAALTNVLVNNPAADTTARDTQLETTLSLGANNTVFSAYVDTGSWDGVSGGANDHLVGLSMSDDGGATWSDLGPLPDTILGDGINPVLAR